MPHPTARRRTRQIESLRTQFAQTDGLAFSEVLTPERVEQALREEGATWRDITYSPLLTLWAFLGQEVLSFKPVLTPAGEWERDRQQALSRAAHDDLIAQLRDEG